MIAVRARILVLFVLLVVSASFVSAQEPVDTDGRCQLGAQYLQRHLSLVLQVSSEICDRHAATAQFAPGRRLVPRFVSPPLDV